MTTTTWLIGDVFERLAELPDQSVSSVISSPPYWRKRRYLPADHPLAAFEIGQESSPGAFLATMLRLTDELWRVLRDDGTIWINLGDTASGSGGAGGDYDKGGARAGQNRYVGTARAVRDASPGTYACTDMPRRKSVCWIPALFGASLAYGRNLLTGEPCRQWVTRPPVTWCKPSPTPGEILDKFREATELFVWAAKVERGYYFDLDAVLLPPARDYGGLTPGGKYDPANTEKGTNESRNDGGMSDFGANPDGVPPLDWWVVNSSGYDGAHYATFPPELITRPVIASCPARVCRTCGEPSRRIVERRGTGQNTRRSVAGNLGDPRTNGAVSSTDVPAISDRNTVGWTDCGHNDWQPGTILDPFGGSGTTGMVANGHGRHAICIDFDDRNVHLARERIGMFLDVQEAAT